MMRIKQAKTVSYLGVTGSYSYQAACTLFPKARLQGFNAFSDVVDSVTRETSMVAVVPIENSIAGRVADVHGLMISTGLLIAGEHLLRIEHCLIGGASRSPVKHVDLAKIERVHSKPEALTQCRKFLDKMMPNAERIARSDTASAVEMIVKSGSATDLAIGSGFAAEIHGGTVIERNIADGHNNTTRFLALTKEGNLKDAKGADFTSLIFQVDHKPGALIDALSAFRECDVNLTKLETYMVSEEFRNPNFYVDIGAGLQEEAMQHALSLLKERTIYIKLLGTYAASPDRSAAIGFLPA